MSTPIFYIDRSTVTPGRLDELKGRIAELARLVEEREPRLLAYQVAFDEAERTMSVIHVHPDSSSLESHFQVAGPSFASFSQLVELRSIDLYGRPDPRVLEAARAKAAALGDGAVALHEPHAGFLRTPALRP